jgi:hypothetical protein
MVGCSVAVMNLRIPSKYKYFYQVSRGRPVSFSHFCSLINWLINFLEIVLKIVKPASQSRYSALNNMDFALIQKGAKGERYFFLRLVETVSACFSYILF